MPHVALADGFGFGVVRAVMDNEMQDDGRVGAVNVLILSGVISGSDENDAIPFVGFAGGDRKLMGSRVVDGQVERIDLRAPVRVKVRIEIGAGLGIGTAIACCPRIGINRGLGDRSVHGMVDGQMQRHDTVATVAIRERAGVVARSSKRFVIPDMLSAYRFCEFCEICGIDRQMQGVHARTPVRIFVFVGICARCGVRFPVPDIAHAGGVVLNLVRAVTNNEMQSDSGVGPVNVLILSGVVSRCGVNDAIPFVGFAGGD